MDLTYIPWMISAGSLLVAYLTYTRNKGKDISSEHESLLKANMKLDQICGTTNETRTDIKALDSKFRDMDKRLAIVEREIEDLKSKGE